MTVSRSFPKKSLDSIPTAYRLGDCTKCEACLVVYSEHNILLLEETLLMRILLKKPWRQALDSLEFDPMPRIHDLRHCWKTNEMRSGLHPLVADVIVGHGDRKKDVKSVCLTISDADLVRLGV